MKTIVDVVGAVKDYVVNGFQKKSTIKTATLAATDTSVEFTGIPTSGNYIIDFFTSNGMNYTAIDTSVSGKVTLTYPAPETSVTVYCEIKGV